MFDSFFNISDQSSTSYNSVTRKHCGYLPEEREASHFGPVHTPSTSCSIFSSVCKQTLNRNLLHFTYFWAGLLLELCADQPEEAGNLKLSSSCLKELDWLNLCLNAYTTRIVIDFITEDCVPQSCSQNMNWCHLWFCCRVMFLTLFKSSCTQLEVIFVPNIFHCWIFSFLSSWVTVVS